MDVSQPKAKRVAIVGGGPAGLMAAEILAQGGADVTVFERMPHVGRKLLMAGRGGLNITHSESYERFVTRYGAAAGWMRPILDAFTPAMLIKWCEKLGHPTFTGTSGRIFPHAMKASPILRAWVSRLTGSGVKIVTRFHWTGWNTHGDLTFEDGSTFTADAVVLALGGASWPRLGANGDWQTILSDLEVTPLRPANCGFYVDWSAHFRGRYAGAPLKRITLSHGSSAVKGEAMITADGLEGGAIYALSASLRDTIVRDGFASVQIDLRPDLSTSVLRERLTRPRAGASLSNVLRKQAGLPPPAIGLVQEALHSGQTAPLADLIKALPVCLTAPFALERAISTAGGIALSQLDSRLMLSRRPGVFVAGEMLDWEAPTGGYLLQGCMATGMAAGHGALAWLAQTQS